MIERVTYTTQPSAQSMGRYITVYAPDGSYVSRHINMEECTESALAHAQANEISGTYRFVPPEKHMSVQIIKTVPGVFTGSFIAAPITGLGRAVGYAGSVVSGGGDNEARILAILNGRSPHFAYSTPADPVTTREVTVTSAAQFNSEALTGSVKIIINSSFSGNIQIRGNDVDVVMSNSATITGALDLGTGSVYNAQRIRWTGGNVLGTLTGRQFSDVLFDDFYLNSGAAFNDLTANSNPWDRLAFINTTITNSTSGGSGWTLFTLGGNGGGLSRPNDTLIMGNTVVINTGGVTHCHRIMGTDNVVYFDVVSNPNGLATSGLRFHYDCENVWVKDSWIRGNMHVNGVNDSDPGPAFRNGTFDNMDRYTTEGQFSFDAGGGSSFSNALQSGEVTNCTLHNLTGTGTVGISSCNDGGGNSNAVWDGSTVPDYSAAGAVR